MATPGKTPCDCGKGETHYRTSYKLCGKRPASSPPPGAPVGNPKHSQQNKASFWASGNVFTAALKPGDCHVELHYRGSVFKRDITSDNLELDDEVDGNTVFAFFDDDAALVEMLKDEEVCSCCCWHLILISKRIFYP